MTWFIDTGRFPVVSSVAEYGYPGRRPYAPPSTRERAPFSEEEKQHLPKLVRLCPRGENFAQHIVHDHKGFLLLSEPALNVLRGFQGEHWEAFPISAEWEFKTKAVLAGDVYYLLNVLIHRDILDLEKSDLSVMEWPQLGGGVKTTMELGLDGDDHRVPAVKKSLIGDLALWMGQPGACGKVHFVADPLRNAWCDLGIDPQLFEPCADV